MVLTPTVSTLSVGGLLQHVASTERGWIDVMLQREREYTAAEGWPATPYLQPWEPPT